MILLGRNSKEILYKLRNKFVKDDDHEKEKKNSSDSDYGYS